MDDYMGSGKMINKAIKKHGLENFKKEILFCFDNESDMNAKEAELVTEEFCKEDTNYNLCPGGKGGWGYVNTEIWGVDRRKEHNTKFSHFKNIKPDELKKLCQQNGKRNRDLKIGFFNLNFVRVKKYGLNNAMLTWTTQKCKDKKKESYIRNKHQQGDNNSQFGTKWINNGDITMKIQKEKLDEYFKMGFKLGRLNFSPKKLIHYERTL